MTLKRQWLALLGMVLLTAQCAQEPAELKTEKDKVNYGIGVSIGKSFKQQGMEVNVDLMVKGLKDELTGKKLLLSDDELRKTMTAYQQELRQKQMRPRQTAGMDNKKAGEDFLAENKKKEGVVTLRRVSTARSTPPLLLRVRCAAGLGIIAGMTSGSLKFRQPCRGSAWPDTQRC